MKIAITGGSGFIGKRLIAYLIGQGFELINISRSASTVIPGVTTITWDELLQMPDSLRGIDAILIWLANPSVNDDKRPNRAFLTPVWRQPRTLPSSLQA